MPYTTPPSDPLGTGIAGFLQGFGSTVKERDSENRKMQGQQALEKYKMDIEKQKEKGALDRTKLTTDAKLKTAHTHDSNAALQTARRGLNAVQKAETALSTYKATAMNPTGTNPIRAHHIVELIKANQAQGMDPTSAKNKALNQAFKEDYPDIANVIYQAHSSGTIAHTLQTFSQLAGEYPNIALKYGQQSPPSTPQPTPTPIAQPKPVSMVPEIGKPGEQTAFDSMPHDMNYDPNDISPNNRPLFQQVENDDDKDQVQLAQNPSQGSQPSA